MPISFLFCVCDTADALLDSISTVLAWPVNLWSQGALDAAEKRAIKAEAKLKKLEAEMPYLKGALEAKERRASAAEKALDAADNA